MLMITIVMIVMMKIREYFFKISIFITNNGRQNPLPH